MYVRHKKIYYCDFCRQHRMTKPSMEKHEKHCTLNPDRECRVCGEHSKRKISSHIASLRKAYSELIDKHLITEKLFGMNTIVLKDEYRNEFKKLLENVVSEIDCPACVLACLRQAGNKDWVCVDFWYDYKEEMKDYFAQRNAEVY